MSEEEIKEEDVIRYLEGCNESQDIYGFCYIPARVCNKILKLYNKEKEKNEKAIKYIKTHKHYEGHSYRDLNNNGKLVFERIETTLVSGTDLLELLEEEI